MTRIIRDNQDQWFGQISPFSNCVEAKAKVKVFSHWHVRLILMGRRAAFCHTTTTTIVIFILAILLFLFLVIIGSDISVSSQFPNRTYKTKLIERERAHETSDNEDYNLIATFEGNEDINNMITIVMGTARQGTFPHVGKSSLVARGEVKPSALRDLRPT